MSAQAEIEELKKEVADLRAEVTRLSAGDFRGSKADAYLAMQYDMIPSYLKSPRSIEIQSKFAYYLPAFLVFWFVAIMVLVIFLIRYAW